MHAEFQIEGRWIGPGHPAYVIAEMSGNHRQDFEEAERILRAAKEAGADAVKIQTYTPDTMTIDCDGEPFTVKGTLWEGRRLYDLYAEAHTPWEWQPRLLRSARELGLTLFSTAFDDTSVDFLEEMGVAAYKVASFENTDVPLLRRVARTGKPIFLSVGMATLAEIEQAVETIREAGGTRLALLKCVSAYPAPADEMNLRTIPHLAQTFGVPVGLSDHTLETAVSVAAVAMGACVIEKHLTMCRAAGGPDSAFSLEPAEFAAATRGIRVCERALGRIQYGPSAHELPSLRFRRSLFAVRDIRAGEPFTAANVRPIRPASGLAPRHLATVLTKNAKANIVRGTPLTWDLVA